MSTQNPITYGDTLTLPGIPGVEWRVDDARDIDKAGDTYAKRASIRAYPAGGTYARTEPVKIGRAERAGVTIEVDYSRDRDNASAPPTIRAYATAEYYGQGGLTDAQRKLIEDAFAPLLPRLVLPMLTPDEVAEKITRSIAWRAESAARDIAQALPDRYNTHEGSTHAIVSAMLTAEHRAQIVAAAVEAFAAQAADTVRRY